MTETLLVAEARVPLADPRGMVETLCAHFVEHAHVTRTAEGGLIESPFGRAELRAGKAHLHLRAEGVDATALYVVKNALAEHLAIFAGDTASRFSWSGDAAGQHRIPFFHEMRVVGAQQLTPKMRRVTLAGGDVAALDGEAGLHVRLLIPPAGRPPVWPVAAPDGRTLWPKGEDALIRRVYTIRRLDPAAGTIDVDMVLHEDDDAPGSRCAARAQPGDPVGVMGPGGGLPPDADWHVLAGDETALPVIARIAEGLPAGRRVIALVEVADMAEEQPIASHTDLQLRWLHRDGAPAGTTDLLERALRAMEWPVGGRGHVTVGCEHRAARAIRSWLRAERGMAKQDAQVAAYWRLGRSGDTAVEEQDRE
ncbi:siderophore-interacting protein [Starkeya sp. 3C]|uniref:Siderophore-interacting protein n=1 Tax=Ancylobacter moscoviensis TaxID=2597768 RepID=A0ABY3DP35_9HYPH|nr:siderophore-interacting protein [Ancylobacter moscoviensis]TSJ61346.1 siderophore-interacting protein [Ancylobacter moscoviensis]